jgi:transposase
MPAAPAILPDPSHFHLLHLSADAQSITATVITTASSACCPLCAQPSTRIHSRYTLRLADLPWYGIAMKLVLHTRKFFCDTPECACQIFTERLPELVRPYARRNCQ